MRKKCTKVRFTTKKHALSSLNYIRGHEKRKKMPERTYFCESCQGWHFTSQKKNDVLTYEFKLPEDKEIVEKINDFLG